MPKLFAVVMVRFVKGSWNVKVSGFRDWCLQIKRLYHKYSLFALAPIP